MERAASCRPARPPRRRSAAAGSDSSSARSRPRRGPHPVLGRGLRLGARPALPARRRFLSRDGPFANLAFGFAVAFFAAEPALLLRRRPGRDADRRPARHRAARHDRHAAAADVQRAAGRGPDHAGRHLLRRAIRRLDHRHPGQPAGRDRRRRHLHRRLPDGAAGTRRPGPRHRGDRLLRRRHVRHAPDRAVRPAAGGSCPALRRAGIFLADADGPRGGRRPQPGDWSSPSPWWRSASCSASSATT